MAVATEIPASLPPFTVPWYRTLFFRVVVLCAVLLACLFGALLAVTRHFFQEASAEMEAQTEEIARSLELRFEEGFKGDYRTLESDLMDLNKGVDIKIEDEPNSKLGASFTMERLPDGRFVRVERVPLKNDGRPVLMTATVTIVPQTEILRAFKNKYMLAVLAVFLVALGMMVWVIWKALHPLQRLSESCAAISGGHLENVGTRGASGEILALETTFNRMVDALREKEAVEARLREQARLRSTHYSTYIEGNRLTLAETREAVEGHGVTFHGRERDVAEVRNYWQALLRIEEWAAKGQPLTENLIRRLHALVEYGPHAKPTPYRDGQNAIRDSASGALIYLPPEAHDVPVLMAELVRWVQQAEQSGLPVPLIAALGAVAFLSERLTARLVIAGLCILGGVAMAILAKGRAART